MATCAHCNTQETQLYTNGVPICLDCVDGRTKPKPPATDRTALLQDVLELTARTEQATEEFEGLMGQVPNGLTHPEGTQRIKNASAKLSTARSELMNAHRRLEEQGVTLPEDLKRSG